MKLVKINRNIEFLKHIKEQKAIVLPISNDLQELEENDLLKFTYKREVEEFGEIFTDKDGYEKMRVRVHRVDTEHENLYLVISISQEFNTVLLRRILWAVKKR